MADAAVAAALKAPITDTTINPTTETLKASEAANPLPPPSDGPATATALPANLPAGTYLFSYQVCGAGTCQEGSQTVVAAENTGKTIADQISSVFSQTSKDCSGEGVSCQDRYSGFNGSSFTASRFIKACSGDVCATASVSIKMVLQ